MHALSTAARPQARLLRGSATAQRVARPSTLMQQQSSSRLVAPARPSVLARADPEVKSTREYREDTGEVSNVKNADGSVYVDPNAPPKVRSPDFALVLYVAWRSAPVRPPAAARARAPQRAMWRQGGHERCTGRLGDNWRAKGGRARRARLRFASQQRRRRANVWRAPPPLAPALTTQRRPVSSPPPPPQNDRSRSSRATT